MIICICPTCGHEGRYRSAALADHHFNRHSCAAVKERQARTRRRLQRLAASGERRDCTHPRARHQHGTRNAYVLDLCRCYECKVASRETEAARRRRITYGRPGAFVDAEPAREHMRALMAQGMGWKRISEKAGLSSGSVYPLLYGKGGTKSSERRPPRSQILAPNSAAILAVTLDLAPALPVANVGTARRIQALVAVGWSMSKIGRAVGIDPGNFVPVAHGLRAVRAGTAKAIADLYDAWWDQKPPTATKPDRVAYTRSVRYAASRGWPPPLAWDDDEIDNPAAHPFTETEQRTNATAARDDVEWLIDSGASKDEIAARLRVSPKSLQNLLTRTDPDLWARIRDAEERRRTAPRKVA